MKTKALTLLALAAVSSMLYAQQQTTNAGSAQNTQQVLAAQPKMIADLSRQVKELEQRIQILERRNQLISSSDLSPVKLELARFDNGCESEQDRAAAVALAERQPAQTYMGGAAMNCTERLKKIVDKLVETIERRQ